MVDLVEGLRADLVECRIANTALQASVSELRAMLNAANKYANKVCEQNLDLDGECMGLRAKLAETEGELQNINWKYETVTEDLNEAQSKLDQALDALTHTVYRIDRLTNGFVATGVERDKAMKDLKIGSDTLTALARPVSLNHEFVLDTSMLAKDYLEGSCDTCQDSAAASKLRTALTEKDDTK